MNRYDSFEEEKFFSTELQNGKIHWKKIPKIYMRSIINRQQMLDLQMPSFTRGDEDEDAADLF